MNNKFTALFAGIILVSGLSIATAQATENPFAVTSMNSQQLAMESGHEDDHDTKKSTEGKCGGKESTASKDKKESKSGEGKCGSEHMKKSSGKCGGH